MAKTDAPQRDMTSIGEVATPSFVRLPEPLVLFNARAERFRYLADRHDLRPYLLFLAGIEGVAASRQDVFRQSQGPRGKLGAA